VFRHRSITRKLMTAILTTSATVLVVTCGTFIAHELVTFRQSMRSTLSTLGEVIAANSTASLAFDNPDDASQVLSALAAERHIVAAALYDRAGALFATYPNTAAPAAFPTRPDRDGYRFEGASLIGHQPVAIGERRLGTLYLQSDLGAMYERLVLYGVTVVGAIILSGAVALTLSLRLQRHISRPVLALAAAARTVSETQDYSVRAEKLGDAEVGELTDAFNAMLARVQEQNRALRERGDELRREVADRVRAEGEVRALNADLERRVSERTDALAAVNKELESFSYSVSHDLRAPLRHVLGYVDLLCETTAGQLSGDSERYLRTIREASVEMGQLIDDLLAFSRMRRADMQEGRVPLADLLQETIRGLEVATQDRQIAWRITPLPDVVGDRAMLKQVLANLVGNAVKYTRKRERAEITIGCSGMENGRVVIFVRDNGAGFDMRYAQKLFGVFQRLHRPDEFEGTGIGLATVQRIVARHGGRVWAEGAPEQGAMFYFTMRPAAAEHAAPVGRVAS